MTQDPKAVVERFWVEVWNDQNPAAAEELLAEGFVWTTPTLGSRSMGQAPRSNRGARRDTAPRTRT